MRAAVRPGETGLFWIETPSNPLWTITDIAAIAEIAHGCNAVLCVNSTVATPILTRPLSLGADIVMHSATKYLNGHADVIAGSLAVARTDALWETVGKTRAQHGNALSGFEAWLLMRGMRTLDLRVHKQAQSTAALASRLARHRAVSSVLYPGTSTIIRAMPWRCGRWQAGSAACCRSASRAARPLLWRSPRRSYGSVRRRSAALKASSNTAHPSKARGRLVRATFCDCRSASTPTNFTTTSIAPWRSARDNSSGEQNLDQGQASKFRRTAAAPRSRKKAMQAPTDRGRGWRSRVSADLKYLLCKNEVSFRTGSDRVGYGFGQYCRPSRDICMRMIRGSVAILSLVFCSALFFSPTRAQVDDQGGATPMDAVADVSVDVSPPPLPDYDQPPFQSTGYMWVPGYWAWDDGAGYYSVPGTWVLPPEPELLWTPGYWGWDNGLYVFHAGYWVR